MKLIPALLLFAATAAVADVSPAVSQLPSWSRESWTRFSTSHGVRISRQLDPFMQSGDFNGDGKTDVALAVEAVRDKQLDILILHREGEPTLLHTSLALGGGQIFRWSVQDKGTTKRSLSPPLEELRSDGLVVVGEWVTTLIYFDKGEYRFENYEVDD